MDACCDPCASEQTSPVYLVDGMSGSCGAGGGLFSAVLAKLVGVVCVASLVYVYSLQAVAAVTPVVISSAIVGVWTAVSAGLLALSRGVVKIIDRLPRVRFELTFEEWKAEQPLVPALSAGAETPLEIGSGVAGLLPSGDRHLQVPQVVEVVGSEL